MNNELFQVYIIFVKYDCSSKLRSNINSSTPSCNFLNSLCYARTENLPRIVSVILKFVETFVFKIS